MPSASEKDPRRVAQGQASQRKGDVAEVEIAKRLETWWRVVEPDARFVRTPLSGGWGDAAVRKGFRASGDVMTTATRWPWVVEIKNRVHSWRRLRGGGPSPVWAWWAQTVAAAEEAGADPLLIFRSPERGGVWRCIGAGVGGAYVVVPSGVCANPVTGEIAICELGLLEATSPQTFATAAQMAVR